MSQSECMKALPNETLTDSMFCAGGTAAIGVCWVSPKNLTKPWKKIHLLIKFGLLNEKGDGGGPMMTRRGDVLEQTGIISFAPKQCQEIQVPAIYTKVSSE